MRGPPGGSAIRAPRGGTVNYRTGSGSDRVSTRVADQFETTMLRVMYVEPVATAHGSVLPYKGFLLNYRLEGAQIGIGFSTPTHLTFLSRLLEIR
jgi:hypothetical protein